VSRLQTQQADSESVLRLFTSGEHRELLYKPIRSVARFLHDHEQIRSQNSTLADHLAEPAWIYKVVPVFI